MHSLVKYYAMEKNGPIYILADFVYISDILYVIMLYTMYVFTNIYIHIS